MIFQGIKSAISYAALHMYIYLLWQGTNFSLVGWLVGWLVGIQKIIIVTYHMSRVMFHMSRAKLFCGISHFFTTIILHRMLYIKANVGSWDTSHTWFLSNNFPKKVGIYIYPHISFYFHFWHNIFLTIVCQKKSFKKMFCLTTLDGWYYGAYCIFIKLPTQILIVVASFTQKWPVI